MNSRFAPLLLAYGEGPPDDASAPEGQAADVETALLRTTRAALDSLPPQAPPSAAVEAVLEAARAASSASELAAVRAVMASSGEGGTSREYALLASTWQAVSRLERPAPPPNVIEAIVRSSASAARSSDLEPLRRALGGADARDTESRLLSTTLDAVGQLPGMAPPADTVAAILAAAADAARASDLAPVRAAVAGGTAGAGAEEAMLRSTWKAVERIPRSAPPTEAVHAVLAAASAASPAGQRARRQAMDRAAQPGRYPLRLLAYATTAFAFIGLVSVALWTSGDGRPEMTASTATEEAAPAPVAPTEEDAGVVTDGAMSSGPDLQAGIPTTVAPSARRQATGDVAGAGAPLIATSPPPPPPLPPVPSDSRLARAEMEEAALQQAAAQRPAAGVGLVTAASADASPGAGLAGTPAVAPTWEAGADVRMLSLRLASLQEQSAGVDWEEPPTALGAREEGALTPAGFNAVGTSSAPARFQVRVNPND